jgi:hypothetical protein
MYMKIFQFEEKGDFYYTESTRQEKGYDIYFIPEGRVKMIYISTVNDLFLAQTHCLLFKEMHNKYVEEHGILEEIEQEVRHLNDEEFENAIKTRLEKKRPCLEKILGRLMTEKDFEDYTLNIREWHA